jgi:hypothetical protein
MKEKINSVPWREGLIKDLQNPEFAQEFLNQVAEDAAKQEAIIEELSKPDNLPSGLLKQANRRRDELNAALRELAALKAGREWVAVGENNGASLPELGQSVLVWIVVDNPVHPLAIPRMENAVYRGKYYFEFSYSTGKTVTHWMPLPPAPISRKVEGV